MVKMQFQKCTPELYHLAVEKHFARLTVDELILRYDSPDAAAIMKKYVAHAEYPEPPPLLPQYFCAYHTIYFVYNDVEYNFPHTLNNIIILPKYFKNVSPNVFRETIVHELMHIYFRYHRSAALHEFCQKKSIMQIYRPRFRREITNPDTYTTTGIRFGGKILFVVLVHPYEPRYYSRDVQFGVIRPATESEKKQYNFVLPYPQNEHPEEILAHLVAKHINNIW
jgi:hypothetical protein